MNNVVNLKGKPLILEEFKPMVSPPVQNTLAECINGALAINRIAQTRLPTAQEIILQGEWLRQAQEILKDRRYR